MTARGALTRGWLVFICFLALSFYTASTSSTFDANTLRTRTSALQSNASLVTPATMMTLVSVKVLLRFLKTSILCCLLNQLSSLTFAYSFNSLLGMSYSENTPPVCDQALTDWLSQLQLARQQLCVDKRVPSEIWERICSYLYLSQLSRLSRVSQSLYGIVMGLNVWSSRYLRFDTPSDIALSKDFARYTIALSYSICEKCLGYSNPCPDQLNRLHPRHFSTMPLPVAEWPETVRDDGTATALVKNNKVQRPSMIRLCKPCRLRHFRVYPESIPPEVLGSYLSKDEVKEKYTLGVKTIKSIKERSWWPVPIEWETPAHAEQAGKCARWYSEQAVLGKARQLYGGDVGIRAYHEDRHDLIAKSREKTNAYLAKRNCNVSRHLTGVKWFDALNYFGWINNTSPSA